MLRDTPYFLLTLLLSLSGQVLLKRGAAQVLAGDTVGIGSFIRDKLLQIFITPAFLQGVVLCGLGLVSWIYVLSRNDLSRALPALGGIGYLVMFLVGRVVLKEQTNMWNLAGIVLVIGGVYLIALKGP